MMTSSISSTMTLRSNTPLLRTFFVALLLVVAATSVVIADDEIAKPTKAEAKTRLATGAGLYRAREFEKAIEEFKAGVVIEDSPIFHFNLGQAYRQLGRYEDSIWHFERFLRRANPLPAKYKDAVESLVRDMKAELDRKAMTRPPVEPADGETKDVVKTPPPPTAQPTPIGAPPMDAAPWYADGIGWGLAGTGVAAGSVSLFLFVSAGALDDDANAEPTQTRQDELHDRASSRRLAGTIIGVVGAGALVTGIIKLAITPGRAEATERSVSLGFTPDGVVVTGRF